MATKTKNIEEIEPLDADQVAVFCQALSPENRIVVANCIVGELGALGCAGTRAGSNVWEKARTKAVSTIVANSVG